MKNGRACITSLIIFAHYLRGLSSGGNKNICRYLPFFVNMRKTLYAVFLSYSVD